MQHHKPEIVPPEAPVPLQSGRPSASARPGLNMNPMVPGGGTQTAAARSFTTNEARRRGSARSPNQDVGKWMPEMGRKYK